MELEPRIGRDWPLVTRTSQIDHPDVDSAVQRLGGDRQAPIIRTQREVEVRVVFTDSCDRVTTSARPRKPSYGSNSAAAKTEQSRLRDRKRPRPSRSVIWSFNGNGSPVSSREPRSNGWATRPPWTKRR